MISSQEGGGETCPRIKLAISQRAAILPGADLPSLSGYASACNAQPKTATDLLQIVNFTSLLQLVNKLQQTCQSDHRQSKEWTGNAS